jgi:hypothetical protein
LVEYDEIKREIQVNFAKKTRHLARAGRFLSGWPSSAEAESKPRFSLAILFDLSMYLVCIFTFSEQMQQKKHNHKKAHKLFSNQLKLTSKTFHFQSENYTHQQKSTGDSEFSLALLSEQPHKT